MLVELTRADADDEDYTFAADQVARGADEAAVVRRLVRRGLDVSEAGQVARQSVEARAGQKSGTVRAFGVCAMAFGAFLMVTGALGVTSQGPEHPATWGTVVIGWFIYRPSRPAGRKPQPLARRPAGLGPQPLGGGYVGRYVGRGMLVGAAVGLVVAGGGEAFYASDRGINVVMVALAGSIAGLVPGCLAGLACALVRKPA